MKPEVLSLREADDPRDVVHRVVERLAQGGLVAVPTETVYGLAANALAPETVERLLEVKGRAPDNPLTLCVKSGEEALDWVPGMGRLGQRLVRRCWPGPVTLVFNETVDEGLVGQLPETVRPWVSPDGSLGLRVPAHEAVLDCQRLLPCPLVLTSANRSGEPAAVTGAEVIEKLGDAIELVLDDGPCRYGQPSSVVRVSNGRWEMIHEGVVTEAALQRLSRCVILFVCTGNTCRSPMAEAICKMLLAKKLGCKPEDLPARGYEVISAGLAALSGDAAAPEAVEVARTMGFDLRDHVTQGLTAETVYQADYIFTMTESQYYQIVSSVPEAAGRVEMLRRDGGNIADPVGLDIEAYRRSAREIEANIRQIVENLGP